MSTTVAPGITPPCASFTLPDTVPVVICASAGAETSRIASIRPWPTRSTLRRMFPPPCNRLHGAQGRKYRLMSQDKKRRAIPGCDGFWRRDPMNKICAPLLVLFLVFAAELVHVVSRAQAPAPPSPDYNAYYQIGPDSLAHDGVPRGEVRGPFALPSQAYPGTQHTYWVHVPAQSDPAVATSLMIFQDGQAFKDMDGVVRAPNVLDNLIYRREIPVMITVDRKSTRLNSSHLVISYAVFCLKKKKDESIHRKHL